MSESNYRMERIERLLRELEYEVVRGMMDREIDETIVFQFIVPVSQSIPNGTVMCEFRTRPGMHFPFPQDQKLRIVGAKGR